MSPQGTAPTTVLFLCTGNSARSILAEVILNSRAGGRYAAYSAGSQPAGCVNPAAIRELERKSHDVEGLASKSWDAFAGAAAPSFDFVITVCDNAAGESCPVWNGSPVSAHWGIPDPAAVKGSDEEIAAAFDRAYGQLSRRIDRFLSLPLVSMEKSDAGRALNAIGATSS